MMEHFKKDFSYRLYLIFSKNNLRDLFRNIDTKLDCISFENNIYILTVTEDVIKANSYPVSMNTMIFDYSKDELVKISNQTLKSILFIFINFFEHVFKISKIDTNIFLNSYIFSTNFFNKKWETLDIDYLVKNIISRYINKAIILRSVNEVQNPNLYKRLLKDGWVKLVSRQVYIFKNWEKILEHHNTKLDLRLLSSAKYSFRELDGNNFEDFQLAEDFYNKLYLDKYSRNNIQYTAKYLQELHLNNLIVLRLLIDNENNTPVGVVGITGEDGVITAPIVGYNTNLDKKEALYRRIIIYIIKYAKDNNLLLNLSSGASDFKIRRGADAQLEYMFVYTKHLSIGRKIFWKLLAMISEYIYGPLLVKLKL